MRRFGRRSTSKLEKAYAAKLLEARDTQRAGDIQRYAALMEEAALLNEQLEAAKRPAGE